MSKCWSVLYIIPNFLAFDKRRPKINDDDDDDDVWIQIKSLLATNQVEQIYFQLQTKQNTLKTLPKSRVNKVELSI